MGVRPDSEAAHPPLTPPSREGNGEAYTNLPSPWGSRRRCAATTVGDGGSAMMRPGDTAGVVHPSPDPFPQGKGSASALITSNGNFFGDYLQHPIHVAQHIVVPEADDAVAVGFDDPGAVRVDRAFGMLPAVAFDGEAQGAAGEVGNEVADLVLASKLCAAKLAGAQVRPQALFSVGRFVSETARSLCEALFSQFRTPIPTLPQGEGLLIASRP